MAKSLRLELKEWEQSFAATHQGRKAGREDIKQYPEIGQKLLLCYLPQPSTNATKRESTSSTTDCEDLLQNNPPLITPHHRKSVLLPFHTLIAPPALQTSVPSTLTPSTPQRLTSMIHRPLDTCLRGPSAHRSGLHLKRMAKCSGSLTNFLQPRTRRPLPNEKHFSRWAVTWLLHPLSAPNQHTERTQKNCTISLL